VLRVIVLFPVLLILVVFALSNPQPVQLGFWPTDFALQAPLSLAVLAGLAIGLLLGALVVWGSALVQRRRARAAERRVRLLETELQDFQARLSPRPTPLPPPDA
jgi:putative membrane protein